MPIMMNLWVEQSSSLRGGKVAVHKPNGLLDAVTGVLDRKSEGFDQNIEKEGEKLGLNGGAQGVVGGKSNSERN